MKRIKRIISILCIVVMLPCTIALADTGYSYSTSEVKKFVDELILGLVNMSDDELEYYTKNTVGWEQEAASGMLTYRENKTLGEYVDDEDTTIKEEGNRLILMKKLNFKEASIEATIVITEIGNKLTPIDVKYKTVENGSTTKGEMIKNAAFNTVIGISSVFLVLLLISFIISLFKYIPKVQDAFTKKRTVNDKKTDVVEGVTVELETAVEIVEEQYDNQDDTELVAVIMAAISAMTGASSDSFVVRSIKRVDTRRKR